MDDVRVMMRDCTHRSLVMIDELGTPLLLLLLCVYVVYCVLYIS